MYFYFSLVLFFLLLLICAINAYMLVAPGKFTAILTLWLISTAVIITPVVPVTLFGLMKLTFIQLLALLVVILFVQLTVLMPVGVLALVAVLTLNFVQSRLVMYVIRKYVLFMAIILPSR